MEAQNGVLWCFHRPRATSHSPVSKPPPRPSPKGREICPMRATAAGAPSPSSRTTYHLPRTHRADTRVRPYEEMTHTTSHEQQLQATSYRPLTAVSSFQPSEPVQTGAVSVARGDQRKQRLRSCAPTPTTDSVLDPSFRWGDGGRCSRRGSSAARVRTLRPVIALGRPGPARQGV